ncbi:hypothetical protein [Streptomyces chryseus]
MRSWVFDQNWLSLERLPAYSPELNSVELRWTSRKKRARQPRRLPPRRCCRRHPPFNPEPTQRSVEAVSKPRHFRLDLGAGRRQSASSQWSSRRYGMMNGQVTGSGCRQGRWAGHHSR